jgi:hypothetical protein
VRWAAVLLVLATLVGCTSDDPHPPAAPVASAPSPATPFTVDWLPDGFEPVAQGRGLTVPDWGSDEVGTVEPFTTLAPDGSDDPDDLVVVAATGYAGNQGGLAQASVTYCCKGVGPHDRFRLDGDPAIYSPPYKDRRWSELVVARGDDLALRIVAPGWGRKRLVDLARRTTPSSDHDVGPAVDPPDGWRVLGSVGARAVLTVSSSASLPDPPSTDDDGNPLFWSPKGSYAAVWARRGEELFVTTVESSAYEGLVGISRFPRWRSRANRRDDGFVLHRAGTTAVLRRLDDGPLVLVASSAQRDPDDLWRVATSVRPGSAARWEQQRRAAWGTPPRVDLGTHELARGHRPGYDWLLPYVSGGVSGYNVPAECLKLSTFRYACTQHDDTGQAKVQFASSPEPFLIVSSQIESGSLRVTQDGRTRTLPFAFLPSPYPNQYAIVFDVVHGPYVCDGPAPRPSLRLELLETTGTTTCITH